ncbi:hypothetical protein ACFV4I_10950 [Nocardiopsis alba]|uniref:hypothetical protein n=1 Tax=Nocardiopsis alba TaxID=53437 RepID=UPI0034085E4D
MNEADKAGEMVEQLIFLGTDFRGAMDDMREAASEYVSASLSEYEESTVDALSAVVDSGMNLASDVEGASLTILDTDSESAEDVDAALNDLNGLTRPVNG